MKMKVGSPQKNIGLKTEKNQIILYSNAHCKLVFTYHLAQFEYSISHTA